MPFFDATGKWKTFLTIFNSYSLANNWTDDDQFSAIQLCFREKAVDYLQSQQALGRCQTFRELVQRMSKRFEKQQNPFVKRSEFYTLHQEPEETIDEWADRVLDKGMDAFEHSADEVREEELVRKFTMGCVDKKAAHYVINLKPRNLDDAIQRFMEFKENASLIFGKQKMVRQLTADDGNENDTQSISLLERRRNVDV